MIQSAINNIMTTAGRAIVASNMQKIAEGENASKEIQNEKIRKAKVAVVNAKGKINKNEQIIKGYESELKESKDETRIKELKGLIASSQALSAELGFKRTQKQLRLERLMLKKGKQ